MCITRAADVIQVGLVGARFCAGPAGARPGGWRQVRFVTPSKCTFSYWGFERKWCFLARALVNNFTGPPPLGYTPRCAPTWRHASVCCFRWWWRVELTNGNLKSWTMRSSNQKQFLEATQLMLHSINRMMTTNTKTMKRWHAGMRWQRQPMARDPCRELNAYLRYSSRCGLPTRGSPASLKKQR